MRRGVGLNTAISSHWAGILLALTTLLMIPAEWFGLEPFAIAASFCLGLYILWAIRRIAYSRLVFVGIALALVAVTFQTRTDWLPLLQSACSSAAFIAAFFIAQATLRHAALSSDAIARCGRHLASQPPGRRYIALTSGGHLFGLMLSYGSISLLGGMASANAANEPDPNIRKLRIKRMLLATQRGFVSTLAWSPLAFSFAVSTSIISGSSWGGAVLYGVVSAFLLAGLGWLMDHSVKPPVTSNRRPDIEGSPRDIIPLAVLLAVIMGSVGVMQWLSGVRMVGVVLLAVPLISILWVTIQAMISGDLSLAKESGRQYIDDVIPSYRSEVVLLSMAAFIGTLGGSLLVPLLGDSGQVLHGLPGWTILVGLVWLVPLSGLFGMNPVLSVTLFAPLLPDPAMLHIDPDILVVAITAGWALGGAISPFTATTLIVGMLGKVSAWHVGLRWNGLYTLTAGAILSIWVVIAAYIQGLAN